MVAMFKLIEKPMRIIRAINKPQGLAQVVMSQTCNYPQWMRSWVQISCSPLGLGPIIRVDNLPRLPSMKWGSTRGFPMLFSEEKINKGSQ
jgi:hypothetical protein